MTSPSPTMPRPWWVAVVSGMASYIDAAAITGFSAVLVIFDADLGLDDGQVGLAAGALTLSIAIGALIGGRLGDRYGRRPVFTVTMIIILAAVGLLILAPGYLSVIVGAVLLGLGTGADLPVSLTTISEAATDANRGRLLGFSNPLWAVGVIVNVLLVGAVGDMGRPGGQIIFAHIGAVALLVLIGRLTIPESETWRTARNERALGIQTIRADRAGIRTLLRSPYAAPFAGLLVFYSLTNMVANTNGQYGNYILVNHGGATLSQSSLVSLPVVPIVIIGFLWFMRIADTPRRFLYFTIGGAFTIASPLTLAIFGVSLPTYLASIMIGAVGTAFAFEGIMKVWTQESFPTLVRTTAQGAIIAAARVSAALLAAVTPLLLRLGTTPLYILLTVFATVGIGAAWLVFRTRDRHNEFDVEAAPSIRASAAATE
jgi:inositol transporter-like SP family MFS transporter